MRFLHGTRTLFSKILLLITSTCLALALCEVAVRSMDSFKPPPRMKEINREQIYMSDPEFGFKLKPGQSFFKEYPSGITNRISSSPQGFRGERDLLAADSRPKILFLGDSFTFGLGVGESERFSFLVQSMESAWRVDDLGMNGFGPDLMIMALETFVASFEPDLVCMIIYTDAMRRVNPFYAGEGFPIPRFRLSGERLVKVPYPYYNFWEPFHTVQLFRHAVWKFWKMEDKLNRAIIERFWRLSREIPFKPALVFLPGYWLENETDRRRRDLIRSIAGFHGIPFLDLGPTLTDDRKRYFYKGDIHLNPLGHKVVAQALHHFLAPLVPDDRLLHEPS